jgi:hypothetical protein
VAENASQCIYRPEVRKVSCRGPTGSIVDCPVKVDFTHPDSFKFDVFGLRRDPVKSFVTPVEDRLYELYPRSLDNTTYLDFKIVDGETPVELYFYWGEKSTESGLRVTDRKCFVQLVEGVINKSSLRQVVTVAGNKGEIELFGEILVAEKPATKRWLGFGWPWFGGLGFGFGWGLGWGLPFWG